jgi:hypothetical protein
MLSHSSFDAPGGSLDAVLLEVPLGTVTVGAVVFENCVFRNCHFVRVQVMGTKDIIDKLRKDLTAHS